MSKITSYLRKSPTGRYSYRRRVPDECRKALGKLEHKVSLKTKVHSVALSRAANVNAEFEKAITEARGATETLAASVNPLQRQQAIHAAIEFLQSQGILQKPDYTASGETIRDYEEAIEIFESNYEDYKTLGTNPETWKPIYSPESATDKYDQARRILDGEEPVEHETTLKDSVEIYLAINQEKKQRSPHNQKKFEQAMLRATDRLATFLGGTKAKGYKTPLRGFSRALMRSFRDDLMAKNPNWAKDTVNRDIQRLQAVFLSGSKHYELNLANPFADLTLTESKRAKVAKRRSFTPTEYDNYVEALSTKKNEEMALVGLLMLATGCRTGEVAGLTIGEVKLSGNIPYLEIRHNHIRQVKNDASERDIPVVGSVLERLRAYLEAHPKANAPDAPLFRRYGRDGGTDAASALLNKVIRQDLGISDPTLVSYSSRHSMKDKLRAVETPLHIQEAILGHSAGNAVAEGYGSGIPLDQKLAELAKANECLDWGGS